MKRVRVSLFLRKPMTSHHSIERLFDAIAKALPADRYEVSRLVCPFESKGIIRRLLISLWATLHQGDINHVTGDVNFLGILLPRSRTVLTIHDSASMLRLTGLKRWLYGWIWLRLPILRTGRVTVISQATLQETLKYARGAAGKFRVIPNCVTGGLQPCSHDFNRNQPRILQIGTQKNKNLPRVIEALAGLSCLLVIIGPLSAEHTHLLKERGVAYENHTGLDDAAMGRQYLLADMVVFVSTYEGFGLPILESQTMGRAVITSARAPMDEVAGAGAALVNPDNIAEIRAAIRKIVEDGSYRHHLILAGFENVKRFAPATIAAEYAAVYEELLRAGQGGSY
jgi:glycosyltransferase involved in cell wall biosynthesis